MNKNVYFPFGSRVVRDTYTNQIDPPKEEPIKEESKVEEPKIEVKETSNEEPKVKLTKKISTPKPKDTNEEA